MILFITLITVGCLVILAIAALGHLKPRRPPKCPECAGYGYHIYDQIGPWRETADCAKCRGTGTI